MLDFLTPPAIVSLDYASTSIGLDFGGEHTPNIKKIQLVPDEKHKVNRIAARGIEIWISDDNTHFTSIPRTGWDFQKSPNGVTSITLKETVKSRYLKIHSIYNDTGKDGQPINKATLLNELAQMLRVYEEVDGTKVSEYIYDNAGNQVLRTVKLVNATETLLAYYPNSNRLQTDGEYAYVYDDAGNLIKKGNKFTIENNQVKYVDSQTAGADYWEYDYDLMNRLTEVRNNGNKIVEYGYDPEGLRVVKRANGATIHYVFEGTEPIFEKNLASGKIKSYVYALGKHLARVDGAIGDTTAPTYFYHTDHLGSVRAITDKQGQTVWNTDYSAFGGQISQNGTIDEAHNFTGKELDPDTGLYYFNARWYDSELGRFVEEDPTADPNNPNLYTYCRNNPLCFIDLTGYATAAVYIKNVRKLENFTSDYLFGNNNYISFYPGNENIITSTVNTYTIDFIRQQEPKYVTWNWAITAGSGDFRYNYDVGKDNPGLKSFFARGASGATITDPVSEKIEIDAHHLVATVDGILSPNLWPDEWPGWGGDLQTALNDLQKTMNDYPKKNVIAEANKIIGGSEKYSSFSINDLYADVDGQNIAHMMMKNHELSYSQALSKYYQNGGADHRFGIFINSYGGFENFSNVVDNNVIGQLTKGNPTKAEKVAIANALKNEVEQEWNREKDRNSKN